MMCLLSNSLLFSQGVAINTDGSAPDVSAGLDIYYTNKGFLLPRLTQEQIWSISSPANGLQVFCTTDDKMYIFVSAANQWKEVAYGTGTHTPGTCGYTITKSHMAGPVAPITKTVYYVTVTNIPGEPSKCWITSNLGADHQATAKDDATEASAGWYFQFNRMQGYKHDGTNRTPNTTWIISIDENSGWLAANDPCSLELGTGWRLPTITEWTNVDASGDWYNWNGPWNSALKLHATGYLDNSDGSLEQRAFSGYYWSSNQSNSSFGQDLGFLNIYCDVEENEKAFGFTIRCLRD